MDTTGLIGGSYPREKFPNYAELPSYKSPSAKTIDIIIGIDEAGRGPVLGSLIYSAAFWPVLEDATLSKIGFNDSKQLKEEERKTLQNTLFHHDSIGYVLDEITSQDISKSMLKAHPTSLNETSYQSVIKILSTIDKQFKKQSEMSNIYIRITNIYIDTVGDPEYYKNRLKQGLGPHFEGNFIIEKKADATYKIVSAASILAKCCRDTLLKDWKYYDEEKLLSSRNYGSGYPGDEVCVQWMKDNVHPVFGYPAIVRFSWSTTREALVQAHAHVTKWECDDDEEAVSYGASAITSFFGVAGEKRPKRCSYFASKKMKHILPDELPDMF